MYLSAWSLSGDEITSEFCFFIFLLMSFLSRDAHPGTGRTLVEDTAEEIPTAGGAIIR